MSENVQSWIILSRDSKVAIATLPEEGLDRFILAEELFMKTILMTGAAGGVATFLRRELKEYALRLTDIKVVEKLEATVIGFAFIIELTALKGIEKIKEYRTESLVEY